MSTKTPEPAELDPTQIRLATEALRAALENEADLNGAYVATSGAFKNGTTLDGIFNLDVAVRATIAAYLRPLG